MSGLLIFFFLSIFGAILVAVAIGISVLEAQRQRQLKSVLTMLTDQPEQTVAPIILVDPRREGGWAHVLLARLNLLDTFEERLRQSGLDWGLPQLLGMMGVGALAGFFLGYISNILIFPWLSEAGMAFVLGGAPYWFVVFRRSRRLAQFEEQFPEALDFIARAMRSGHAFSVSLEMLGDETPDPLGREFRTLFNEQNLGAPIEVAIANLTRRVPMLDVRYFVSVVLLQRTTGGNLAEVLTRLAYLIRERFRLRGQVKAASAHGRMTAAILTVLPIVTMGALRVIAPGYFDSMLQDSDGKWMVVAAILAQVAGFLIMRRIVNIKV